jgi:putative SbcD/Mre11-related phosphoesterase
MVELARSIINTSDGLGIYIPEIKTLTIADLHIGVELAIFNEGTYIPIDQYNIMEENIIKSIKKFKPETLIINGDFKHEFSRASTQEWFEMNELIKVLDKYRVNLEIVRGNHDNYLKNILTRHGKELREPYFVNSRFLFLHGHQRITEAFTGSLPDVDWLILAHEHPVIELFDDAIGKHRFRCYLLGDWKKYKVLVLPAFSPFASGSVINDPPRDIKHSTFLNEINLEEFSPIVVDKDEMFKFPILKELIRINKLKLNEYKENENI